MLSGQKHNNFLLAILKIQPKVKLPIVWPALVSSLISTNIFWCFFCIAGKVNYQALDLEGDNPKYFSPLLAIETKGGALWPWLGDPRSKIVRQNQNTDN